MCVNPNLDELHFIIQHPAHKKATTELRINTPTTTDRAFCPPHSVDMAKINCIQKYEFVYSEFLNSNDEYF
jgi:hypothetical protein